MQQIFLLACSILLANVVFPAPFAPTIMYIPFLVIFILVYPFSF
ncbi:conserved hypothetical protein [Listeria ivanovii FSL F6-596]|nr:conserved hypothetical protein [Listeria ivanovii FSL F6-596]